MDGVVSAIVRGDHGALGLAFLFGLAFVAGCGPTPPVPTATASLVTPTSSSTASPATGPTSTPAPTPTASPATGPTSTPAPTPTPAGDVDVLPTPAVTTVVLLLADPAAPTAREQRWLDDLRSQFGRADTLAYRDATAERLALYFTVFVIDESAELDVAALASAYQSGLSVHLVGAAAAYKTQVAGAVP